MGFLVPIATAIGGAIASTASAVAGGVASLGGALGIGGGAAGAAGSAAGAAAGLGGIGAGAAAAGAGATAAAGGLSLGALAGGIGAGALGAATALTGGGTTALEGLTVTAASSGSFADALLPTAAGAAGMASGGNAVTGDTSNQTLGGGASALGTLKKDIGFASDAGSLALLAKSLMLQPPPPQVASSPSDGASVLTSPSTNFSPATFAPQFQAGVNKSISAMAAASLGGTYTGAGQASGQRKTLLGQ